MNTKKLTIIAVTLLLITYNLAEVLAEVSTKARSESRIEDAYSKGRTDGYHAALEQLSDTDY